MAKIIRPKPAIFQNCSECIYHYTHLTGGLFKPIKEVDFCTIGNYNIEDVKGKLPICPTARDKSKTYVYLENTEIIPKWCPLEEYEELK
jgi:hypothetical protein